jgi:hypothetical protein
MVTPPSATMTEPVMNDASGEARKATMPPIRRRGAVATVRF